MIRLFRVVILSLAVASSASPSLAQSTDQLGKGLESLEQGDFKQGFQLIQSVAESGNKEAQFTLAALYVDGNAEMPKNLNEGLRLYKLAAGQGFAPAQNELGVMFLEGRGVAVNEVEGVQWIRRAAEQGYPTAETNLSKSYAHGRGVATDDAEALR